MAARVALLPGGCRDDIFDGRLGSGETMTRRYGVAIIGSGPAGLSAAARAAARGLDHVLLEKTDHLSDTIFKYQRGKHVMATPVQLVLRSDLDFDAGRRETVLGGWTGAAERLGVRVRFRSEVVALDGCRGEFRLRLSDGDVIEAECVVLAIGTAGNPNRLTTPGAETARIDYQLDDPHDITGEDIIVVGGGDAGIENALGLAEPDLGNKVMLLQRDAQFTRAKPDNVALLEAARADGRLDFMTSVRPVSLSPREMIVETREGPGTIVFDRIIARLGAAPARKFVESCGVAFASADREAFPVLTPEFESYNPGVYVIGALAGYPLIKHCLNQGYDVIERILGNATLRPADEPILQSKFGALSASRSVDEWLDLMRSRVGVFNDLTTLQIREFMLDSDVREVRPGQAIIVRNDVGSSLFAILEGSVNVEINPGDPSVVVPLPQGEIFGEIGLISGRRRGATVRAAERSILIEAPRAAVLRLMATAPAVKRRIDAVTAERMIKQIFAGTLSSEDIASILALSRLQTFNAGETLIREGDTGFDIFVIRSGSVVAEKTIGGKDVFLSYVPAGSYVGEMALFDDGHRSATVRATVAVEAIVLPGDAFRDLLARRPDILRRVQEQVYARRQINGFIEAQKSSFGSVADMYSSVADFLVEQGIGEATDALLIDETLCIGCDHCETACAETHEGISRLDREAGRTYAHIHVPTSCRHCENPQCMKECPPNAIHRAPDGEVFIDETCIGCGACKRNCPYGVIQMETPPPPKPGLVSWLLFGFGPGPGQPSESWIEAALGAKNHGDRPKQAVKCDMCRGVDGGPACVRACPTGAAIRVSPEDYLKVPGVSGARE
jgi:CRP-like cAMP-binding protein/Fe-S-cluster-containing hydrogenase component 2/thioredoxin reductase